MNKILPKKTSQNKPKTNTSWGGVAGWYDNLLEKETDSYQKNVIMPNLIRIVGPKQGMAIIESACGQGYFSRAFASHGATVVASDISGELIEHAKKNLEKDAKNMKGAAQFHVASADKLSFAPDASADAVVVVLALQNIENLAGAIAESARVLKPGGRFVFVLNHPAFRIPTRSSWQWDEKEKKQYRRLDGYMSDTKNKIDMTPGTEKGFMKEFTYSFHRPLQSYVKALSKAGLAITRLEEWVSHKESQKGPRADEENRMRTEIPLFMCVEAKKI